MKAGVGWPLNYLGQVGYRFDMDRDKQLNLFADLKGLNDGKVDNREVMNMRLHGDYNFYTANGIKLNARSEEHTSELQSRGHLVCRLQPEKNTNIRMAM